MIGLDDSGFVAFRGDDDNKSDEAGAGGSDEKAPALLTDTSAPWLSYASDRISKSGMRAPPLVRLHNEILAFCEFVSPTDVELRTRDILVRELTLIVQELWVDAKLLVFGSQMTKILTPTSDIDIAILNVPYSKDAKDVTELLIKLADSIRENMEVSYIEAIITAKVPIVKLDHKASGLSVDICINNDSGITTGRLIKKLVREFPPLRILTIVLKTFLVSYKINNNIIIAKSLLLK